MDEPIRNRLAECTSPYLQQHESNPVAWQPWDDDAIELARRLDRPLLVSIGYAACHWCHVMEHESFEDEQTAVGMNQGLVCIKVDREERPDVDALYMAACQSMTGGGGWPLNAFVDPHTLKPFFVGTYFPPEPRFGRPSWNQLVASVVAMWSEERQRILLNSEMVTEHLEALTAYDVTDHVALPELLQSATTAALLNSRRNHDSLHGGFGGAPKFPHPMELEGMLASALAADHDMAASSLDIMAARGLYDHLAGGWHRYCVDEKWAVPHFEKMLYDNALLLRVHELARRSGIGSRSVHDRAIRLTLEWIEGEMLDPAGGVWSTLDADSDDAEGKSEEGEFFLWTPEQIHEVLAKDDARLARARWCVTPEGNFEGSGRSVLALADVDGLSPETEERIRLALLEARANRPRPGTDDKVLTAWNGMLLAACAELPEEAAYRIGIHIVKALLSRSTSEEGDVLRTWRGDADGGMGFLDDHAWAGLGLLRWGLRHDDAACIERAVQIAERMLNLFSDVDGGFWLSSESHTTLPVRQRSESDAAVPAASAVAIELLVTLLTRWPDHAAGQRWRQVAQDTLQRLSGQLTQRAGAYWAMLNAARPLVCASEVWFVHHSGEEPEEVESLRRSAGPTQLVVSSRTALEQKDRGDSAWKAWRCEGMTCRPPVEDRADLVW